MRTACFVLTAELSGVSAARTLTHSCSSTLMTSLPPRGPTSEHRHTRASSSNTHIWGHTDVQSTPPGLCGLKAHHLAVAVLKGLFIKSVNIKNTNCFIGISFVFIKGTIGILMNM